MKKKVLFTATVDSHIKHFHIPYLKMFKEKGYEVHVATNGDEVFDYCDVKHTVSFERNPFKFNNLKAIKQLRNIIMKENFEIIHCHTPMGSVVTRLAAIKARKKLGTRVIYTAHGFHFFKGASKINWLLFYPIEKYLAKYTDDLITINKEDYELAKNKFSTNVHYVPGVGIDPDKFNFKMSVKEKNDLRKSLGLKKDDFVMIYPAELSKRKNQTMVLLAMKKLLESNPNIHVLLPGKDSMNGLYQKMSIELGIANNVHFLGYRTDINKLLKISDLAISTAKQEGLPVNLIEAMACNIPIVATNCRGNRDLITTDKEGFIVEIDDVFKMVSKIKLLKENNDNNFVYDGKFDVDKMLKLVDEIY